MSDLKLYLLGPPRIELDGVELKFNTRKNMALVAYLALTRRSHTRESLATLLWPESDPAHARAGLRRNLSMLRKALDGYWLVVDREAIGSDATASMYVDVHEFQDYLNTWQRHGHTEAELCAECLQVMEQAVGLYRGDFMTGFTLRDSPNFDEWQFFQSEGLRREVATALARLVHGLATQGAFEPAIGYARRWLAQDPLHEPAHQYLMQLYAWSGQQAAALRQYHECSRLLEEELGVQPEEETVQLFEAIRHRKTLPRFGERLLEATHSDILNDRYRLDGEIGRGTFATVYQGRDLLLNREVAVKVYSSSGFGFEGRRRLLQEAQTAARLNHPNIVSIYDAGECEKRFYIVSELTLGQPLKNCSPLSLAEIISLARQICEGLAHAHEHGIVHRDLKPENIIVTAAGTAKLTDFGLAQSVASRIDQDGNITGTVCYLAPELALGQAYDGRADLYSLGVILYELTTGHLPFVADDGLAVISLHLHAAVVPPRAKNIAIQPKLDALIVQLLSKNPDRRPASAAEVLAILEDPGFVAGQGSMLAGQVVTRHLRPSRLVGRSRQLNSMRWHWNRVIDGLGQAILVTGHDGVGKSRLARELATHVQVSGGLVLSGRNMRVTERPFAPIARILHQAIKNEQLENLYLPDFVLADLIRLVPALLDTYPDIEPNPALGDPQAECLRLYENLVIFLDTMSHRIPVLVIVEDIQWADSASLKLLQYLVHHTRQRRVMFLLTCQVASPDGPGDLPAVIAELNQADLLHQIHLRNLSRAKTRELLKSLLVEEISPEFLEGIYSETQGTPFFIEEICKALANSGNLYISDGRWNRVKTTRNNIPQNVQAAINSRFRSLPSGVQELLIQTAIFGTDFCVRSLLLANKKNELALKEALDDAVRYQFVVAVESDTGEKYRFVHDLIPATLAELCQGKECCLLHRRAATALEAMDSDEVELLAYHYLEAGDLKKAVPYLEQSGDRARMLFAHQEAIDHYRQAQRILEADQAADRLSRIFVKLAIAYQNAADFRSSRACYRRADDISQLAKNQLSLPSMPPPHALRIALWEPASISLEKISNLTSHVLNSHLFSGLVQQGAGGKILPDIAYSWETLDGGRRTLFHLRDDICWSDGTSVTAADFECAWDQAGTMIEHIWHRRPSKKSLSKRIGDREYKKARQGWVNLHAIERRTLAVDTENPVAKIAMLLPSLPFYPIPGHIVQEFGSDWVRPDHIVTNGPFRILGWEPGGCLVLERYPAYHGHFAGNAHNVECRFSQRRSRGGLSWYKQDEVDICLDLPPTEWAKVRQRLAGEYQTGPQASTELIAFDCGRPPFNDQRIRQAIAAATDRISLADVALRGFAFPATGGLVPPAVTGHVPNCSLTYEPHRAQYLLAEAGFVGGRGLKTLVCQSEDAPGNELVAEFLAEQWSEILGIECEWHFDKWSDLSNRQTLTSAHIWLGSWHTNQPNPMPFLELASRFPIGWQDHRYCSCLKAAYQATNRIRQQKLIHEAEDILIEQVPLLPLCYGRYHMLVKPWVRYRRTSTQNRWSWKDIILEPH